jgi:hypothetical protein
MTADCDRAVDARNSTVATYSQEDCVDRGMTGTSEMQYLEVTL